MHFHAAFFHIYFQNTLTDCRDQDLFSFFRHYLIDIVCSGLDHIIQCAKKCIILGIDLKSDQICDKILIFLSFTACSRVTSDGHFLYFSI